MNSLCQNTLPYKLNVKYKQTIKEACKNKPTEEKDSYFYSVIRFECDITSQHFSKHNLGHDSEELSLTFY